MKTENNDVYYGEDGYLFKQLLGVDESRFARNVTALANLCERHPGMVDVMIVPSASLVLKDKLPANAPGPGRKRPSGRDIRRCAGRGRQPVRHARGAGRTRG